MKCHRMSERVMNYSLIHLCCVNLMFMDSCIIVKIVLKNQQNATVH